MLDSAKNVSRRIVEVTAILTFYLSPFLLYYETKISELIKVWKFWSLDTKAMSRDEKVNIAVTSTIVRETIIGGI
jgi:hypothetical protein